MQTARSVEAAVEASRARKGMGPVPVPTDAAPHASMGLRLDAIITKPKAGRFRF